MTESNTQTVSDTTAQFMAATDTTVTIASTM